MNRWVALGVVVALLWCVWLGFENFTPQPAPTPLPTPTASPVVSAPAQSIKPKKSYPKRSYKDVQFAPVYSFGEIDQKFRQNRLRMAACFMSDSTLNNQKFKLTVDWNGAGELQQVTVLPAVPGTVTDCVRAIVESWQLKPHGGLQPFRYQVPLGIY